MFRRDGALLRTEHRPRIRNVDEIPRPDWSLFPVEAYIDAAFTRGANLGRCIPILASRGCPYQCTFCSNPQMWTTIWLARQPEGVIPEMKDYITHRGWMCSQHSGLSRAPHGWESTTSTRFPSRRIPGRRCSSNSGAQGVYNSTKRTPGALARYARRLDQVDHGASESGSEATSHAITRIHRRCGRRSRTPAGRPVQPERACVNSKRGAPVR